MQQYNINQRRQKSKSRNTVRQYMFFKDVRSQQIKTFKNYIKLPIGMEV